MLQVVTAARVPDRNPLWFRQTISRFSSTLWRAALLLFSCVLLQLRQLHLQP